MYINLRRESQSLNRIKMKEYFESKNMKNFKNNKLFWEFYSDSIKIKSFNKENSLPNVFVNESVEYSDPHEIGNLFNTFFTSLSSTSLTSERECDLEVDKTFSLLKNKGLINIKTNKFNFVHTTNEIYKLNQWAWSL